VIGLRVPAAAQEAGYGFEAVARTPADAPIVLAVAGLAAQDGRCTDARLIVGGVADAPVRLAPAEALLQAATLSEQAIAEAADRAATEVNPTGDFRGSAEYRRAMAKVLVQRALMSAARAAARGVN
jgi:carbon-monoxide dehydrogenase medium subunit